ncbi:hypothetical protein AB434_2412 [Heyndrickxia coagulans]|uniref:Uncharacterized protein n=1 Tax=Heyndrickxia coagulans TaxID=1398 RepID=A0AAN0WD10_HEYCO|nr:hypothetical protein SB48_HM08orf04617 [Heyndrickxia coagulans]AKN54817.1 hypothetical protein AB434_2412 [Heyndrickxia coagulans]
MSDKGPGCPKFFMTRRQGLRVERQNTHRNEQALLLVLRPHPDVYATL